MAKIATGLAAAITADTSLQAIGVNASANGAVMSIKSASPRITTYTQSANGGTETITLGVTNNFVENAVIGGTKTTGDTVTITVSDPALAGGQTAIPYTVLAGDSLPSIATALKNAINANSGLTAIGVTASVAGTSSIITIKSNSPNATTYSQSTSAAATETISLSINQNGPQTVALTGSVTAGPGESVTLTVYDAGLPSGLKAVAHPVVGGDTLPIIATDLASKINADTDLQGIGASATSSGSLITIQSTSINATTLRGSTSANAPEIISINVPVNGFQTAAIGGTSLAAGTLTITVYDSGLAGGSKAISYPVTIGVTLPSVATGLAAAITGDTNLAAIGVSASATSTVVNILSTSVNNTTYTQSVTGGATETITLAPAASVSQFAYNNVNQLTSIATGGATAFQALTNKTLKSATINSQPATLNWTESFSGNATLSSGVNNVPVSATDAASNVKTNSYQIGLAGPSSSSLTFDNNGNMTSDGTNSYAWDAENRLIQITYPGSGNNSKFFYDPFSGLVKIVETVASSVTSTKQFVRCGSQMCEERDASSAVTKRFFGWGQTIAAINYFYTRDHLGSVRDMTDGSGTVQAHLEYDMWGVPTKTVGALDADFGYAGYYAHARSGLNLTVYRAYNPTLGRWISRDPKGESGGLNLYAYVHNSVANLIDPSGLEALTDFDAMRIIHENNYSDNFSDAILFCQYWKESSFNPAAGAGSGGPAGLGRVTPAAVRDVAAASGIPYTYNQLSDPGINIQVASQYLDIRVQYAGGDLPGALAAGMLGYGTTAPTGGNKTTFRDVLDCADCVAKSWKASGGNNRKWCAGECKKYVTKSSDKFNF